MSDHATRYVVRCTKLASEERTAYQEYASGYMNLFAGSEDDDATAPGEEVEYSVDLTPEGREAFEQASNLISLEEVFEVTIPEESDHSEEDPEAEGLREVRYHGFDQAHARGYKGQGARIGMGDTGLDRTWARRLGRLLTAERDFTGSPHGPGAGHDHGTHVLGIMHQGAPEAELVNAKILGDNGSGQSDWIAAGVRWMVQQGCTEIGLSLSAVASPDNAMGRACEYAAQQNVTVFAAAGNNGCRNGNEATRNSPANHRTTMSTGSVFAGDGSPSGFSACGTGQNGVILALAGQSVASWGLGGRDNVSKSGTSMATPYGAAMSALAGAKATRNRSQRMRAIIAACNKGNRPTNKVGHGVPHAVRYLDQLGLGKPEPPKEEPEEEPGKADVLYKSQIGAFSNESGAEQRVEEARSKGFRDAFVKEVRRNPNSGRWVEVD